MRGTHNKTKNVNYFYSPNLHVPILIVTEYFCSYRKVVTSSD